MVQYSRLPSGTPGHWQWHCMTKREQAQIKRQECHEEVHLTDERRCLLTDGQTGVADSIPRAESSGVVSCNTNGDLLARMQQVKSGFNVEVSNRDIAGNAVAQARQALFRTQSIHSSGFVAGIVLYLNK